ncbi:hypothetical protein WKW80_05725 [Variovorax humicola]|uniref:Uncharacterized protein n=1 Tax=Variovorax humicola TaxID=1769758 RepID=A0ABU8VV50_9BURK
MTAPVMPALQSLLPEAERREPERAMLDTLQAVAGDPRASAAARVRAAKALLEHFKSSKVIVPRRGGKGSRNGLAPRTSEELREALAQVQARKARLQ